MEVKHIEEILKRLIDKPRFNGSMVEDTKEMYEEALPDSPCKFVWVDDRPKPTWAEIEAEYLVIMSEKESETIEKEKDVIKAELSELDKASIRDIRELLVELFPDNPTIEKLIIYEAEAKIKRDKLK